MFAADEAQLVIQDSIPLILTVDDEPANLTLIERLLGPGYHVMSVTNGQDALDMLAQAPFDVVLLDIMMPGMSGLETLQHIRENPNTAYLPVILVSALMDARDISRGLELGANDYITKPIDIRVTRARIQTQLRLKRLEDERMQTIDQLIAAQEMKDKLLRIASHDLKGPLTNMRMVASLLRASESVIPSGSALLEALDTSANTMQTVIEDFLDTAALQNGALKLSFDQVKVDRVVKNLVGQYSAHASRKHIALEVVGVDGVVCADASRFEQALGNLISNAIKYSPEDTIVHIWSEQYDGKLRICVADQGPGIPAQERDRLFTQFGKLSPRPTGGESSTGLGLWIVKHLVTLQQGQVGVHNPPEGGSIFWIEMPAM